MEILELADSGNKGSAQTGQANRTPLIKTYHLARIRFSGLLSPVSAI
jgi:hypothetical protein